jgi:FHS family glucose/mannose:H+ symporter-like MFS transporter
MRSSHEAVASGALQARAVRKALSGFFLAGLLMSFLGAILPAWGYHLKSDFSATGAHFLMMALGVLAATAVAHRLVPEKGVAFVLVAASGLAYAALIYLALVSPPSGSWLRLVGVFAVGLSSGLLASALFCAISQTYRLDPAATVNLAGLLFGAGSLTMALLVAGTFYVYAVPSILFLLALIPGAYAVIYARSAFPERPAVAELSWRQAMEDVRSPSAVLFALLLFFQFANEWSVAGWLAIFLIQRIGLNPASALLMLALYWLALVMGRVAAQFFLSRVSHGRLLGLSTISALFGCVILTFTKGRFGAISGILFLGGGFAMVYPLVVERIGGRFPHFHPALFNGIFSFAMMGGLLAPWTIGYYAESWGIRLVMVVPLLGTFLVTVLLLLIWLEAKLTEGAAR